MPWSLSIACESRAHHCVPLSAPVRFVFLLAGVQTTMVSGEVVLLLYCTLGGLVSIASLGSALGPWDRVQGPRHGHLDIVPDAVDFLRTQLLKALHTATESGLT